MRPCGSTMGTIKVCQRSIAAALRLTIHNFFQLRSAVPCTTELGSTWCYCFFPLQLVLFRFSTRYTMCLEHPIRPHACTPIASYLGRFKFLRHDADLNVCAPFSKGIATIRRSRLRRQRKCAYPIWQCLDMTHARLSSADEYLGTEEI